MEAVAPEDLELVEVEAGEDDVEFEEGLVMLTTVEPGEVESADYQEKKWREDIYRRILFVEVEERPAGPLRCNLQRGNWPPFVGNLCCYRHRRGWCCGCERRE